MQKQDGGRSGEAAATSWLTAPCPLRWTAGGAPSRRSGQPPGESRAAAWPRVWPVGCSCPGDELCFARRDAARAGRRLRAHGVAPPPRPGVSPEIVVRIAGVGVELPAEVLTTAEVEERAD